MKLFAYLGTVLAVIALAVAFLTQRSVEDLRHQIQLLQQLRPFAPSDDQPVTVTGGSLFLGNDPDARWDDGPNKTFVYNPGASGGTKSINKIEIVSAKNANDDDEFQLTRQANTILKVETKYAQNANKYHLVTLATDANGQALTLSVRDDAGISISPKKFMRMLTFLRRHPKKSWQIQSVTITGTSASPIVYTPYAGDISVLLHYCATC